MSINVNMASDADDFDENIENLKKTVRQSFARVYAGLKARELKTLRQLDALRKQCQDDKDIKGHCVQNIQIRYDNEPILLDHVSNYGVIDFEKLNFDSNTFILEDYVSPNDDHMYSYKTIDDLTKNDDNKQLEAIEEAALKQITTTENCVCNVSIKTEDIAKKFRDVNSSTTVNNCDTSVSSLQKFRDVYSSTSVNNCDNSVSSLLNDISSVDNGTEDEKSDSSDPELRKIDPTDDWLNSIKNQTEIEPAVADVMEHSTITCS